MWASLIGVTAIPLLADPALGALAVVLWAGAAMRAAGLPHAGTPRRLSAGAGRVLGLVAAGVVVYLAVLVVDGRPVLVGLPVAASLALTVPRLMSLRRTAVAFHGVDAMPRSLRRDAAHPLVAWP